MKMKCPYCNEETGNLSGKCPVCGEKIPLCATLKEIFQQAFSKLKENKKTVLISVISIIAALIIISGIIFGYGAIKESINSPVYKSIVEKDFDEFNEEEISGKEALNIINELNDDMLELLKSKTFKSRKGHVFKTFLDDLSYYTDVYGDQTGEYVNGDGYDENIYNDMMSGKILSFDGIQIKPIVAFDKKYSVNYVETIELISPKTPSIKYSYGGEGWFAPVINYEYIKEEYSKYLPKDWSDYVDILVKMDNDLNGNSLINDGGITVEPKVIVDWIVEYQEFLKKHPKFMLKDKISDRIDFYSSFVLMTSYITFGYEDVPELQPEGKKFFELYLEKADKKTEMYQLIERGYQILKDNNYRKTREYDDFLDEFSKDHNLEGLTT